MKLLRIFGFIILLLIVIIVLAAISLKLWIDPNRLKTRIEAEVKNRTGLVLKIASPLQWSFYPTLGIQTSHVTISMPNAQPFAELQQAVFSYAFAQLFNRENCSANLTAESGRLNRINMNNIHLGIFFNKNELTLNPITVSLYQGKMQGSASGKALNYNPQWSWDLQASAVQLEPLLSDALGANSHIKVAGAADVAFKASTLGATQLQFIQNLQGSIRFDVKQGKLIGVNLNALIKTADALLNRTQIVTTENSQDTEFSQLSGSGVIQNGLATTQDINLTAATFHARAEGNVSLLLETLQFHLQIAANDNVKTKWIIPVVISGKILAPSVQVDLDALQKILLGKSVVQAMPHERIETKLPMYAQSLLQNLLGR